MEGMALKDMVRKIKEGDLLSKDVVSSYISKIKSLDPNIRAFIETFEEDAIKRAEELDRSERKAGTLFGVPIAIKDNICIKGKSATCSSRILQGYVSPYSATVIERLEREGAVIIGRTNMDEFAMGSSTEHSALFPTRNPFDTGRVPGGSSGGSAAAVSAGMVPCALGSDTGGSIRQPASFCGVTGMKPTYGTVSRFGLVAFASSLDQIGPIARTAEDCALIMDAIAGHDPKDSTSLPQEFEEGYFTNSLEAAATFKLGIPKGLFELGGIEEDVIRALEGAKKVFEDLGFQVTHVDMPVTLEYSVATYYIIATAEASSNLARYDGVKYGMRVEGDGMVDMYKKTRSRGFGDEVKRRIMLGTYVLSSGYYEAYYLKAQKVRRLIRDEILGVLKNCDMILLPTSPTTAFRLEERMDDPLKMYLSDIFTIPANLAGIPAISIPAGLDRKGLPIGIQLFGRPMEDWKVLNVSSRFQKATDHHKTKPKAIRMEVGYEET